MIDLRTAPLALSPWQRWTAALLTVVVAFSRLLAVARSPWDWDEMLFLLALRDYDVGLHHPHPPGFPLFIAAATLFESLGVQPFRALQLVNLIAGLFIVPAMIVLGRELRLSFETSASAAAIFAFLPNIWFFGGTAFSDVAAIVPAVAACGLLLRGARSAPALLAGALLLAVAASIRPQNLLVGALPAVIASWISIRSGRSRAAIAAMVMGMVILAASFGGAVAATGEWGRYAGALVAHREYLAATDSFVSPIRPSLFQVSDDFFVRPFRFAPMNVVLSVLAAASAIEAVIRRRTPILLALAIFGPFWILAWLTLDFHSASRFSIGYMPLLAILSADGISLIFGRVRFLAPAATIVIAAALALWLLPGLEIVRTEESPPVRAVRFIAEEAPSKATIFVQKRMRPFAEVYLDDLRLVHVEDGAPAAGGGAFYLREGPSAAPGATTFTWPRDVLWNVARRRYFEVSVEPR
jgi:hypothetical protein